MPRVLFSLDDTSQARRFAVIFHSLGWEILCTAETADVLREAGIPATDVRDYTGVTQDYGIPPTLHPRIEQALTGPDCPEPIEIVFDIPYPLERGSDVGGRTLLALAAKGEKVPVSTNADMARVVQQLEQRGSVSAALRAELIRRANAAVASHFLELLGTAQRPGEAAAGHGLVGVLSRALRNGENPYQTPCALFEDPHDEDSLAIHRFEQQSGEPPCFTNLADLDCILNTLCLAQGAFEKRFERAPHIALAAKHGNACGFAADWDSPRGALEKALWGNPLAVWGGELVVNFRVDRDLAATALRSDARGEKHASRYWMLDLVAAPDFAPEALAILGKRKARKLLANPALAQPSLHDRARWEIRPVRAGFLRQPPAIYVLDARDIEVHGGTISDEEHANLILAWAVAWSSAHGGNEIALVRDSMLIGAGRRPAATIAARHAVATAVDAGHSTTGAVFAADAFFPFTDAPGVLADAGAVLGLVPGGGRREPEVRAYFEGRGVRMASLPAELRGFCRH